MSYGLHWSSSPDSSDDDRAWVLNLNSSDVYPTNTQSRSNVRASVRCVKNAENTVTTGADGNYHIVRDDIDITLAS